MKKRILCFLLSLLMLVSLASVTAPRAAAASRSTSENAIALLKKLEGFKARAYQENGSWKIGYGTPAQEGDLITEATADQALRSALQELDKTVSQFSITVRRDFTQYEHDAMVLFAYDCGTAWMVAGNRFREAIAAKDTGNEFLTSICQWAIVNGQPDKTLLDRRLTEAGLFLTGAYDTTPPSYFAYLFLDANGGSLSTSSLLAYNTNLMAALTIVPTLAGSHFLGWYTGTDNGTYVTTLGRSVSGMTLYAHWQAEGAGLVNGNVVGTSASYTLSASQAASLKVYETPSTSATVIKTLLQSAELNVVAEYVDESNVKWVKLRTGGWVSLGNVNTPQSSVMSVTVTVTASSVNIREKPGAYAYHAIVRRANRGENLVILDTTVEAGQKWGLCADGWVCLMYTDYEQVTAETDVATGTAIATGVVRCNTVLKIRSGAGTYYAQVGTLNNGDRVVLYEYKTSGGREWGRINAGWICLEYVVLDDGVTVEPGEGSGTGGTHIANGTVINSYVNYRSGPGTHNSYLGKLYSGAKIKIYEIITVSNKQWGRFDEGWVCLDYVRVEMLNTESQQPEAPPETTPGETPEQPSGTYWTAVANARLAVYDASGNTTDQFIKQGETVRVYEFGTRPNDSLILAKVGQGYVLAKYLTVNIAPETCELKAEANLYIRPGGSATGSTLAAGTSVTLTKMQLLDDQTFVYVQASNAWIDAELLTAFAGLPDHSETTPPSGGETTPTEPSEPSEPTEPTDPSEPTEPGGSTGNTGSTGSQLPEGARIGTVVGAEKVNVRSTPGIRFDNLVTTLARGTKVTVYETIMKDGSQWGRIDQGWISMRYVQLNVVNSDGTSSEPVARGFVHGSVNLNVRSGPGLQYDPVGILAPGTEINIYEHQLTAGTIWGRTDQGWVSMHYVTLISTGGATGSEGTEEGSVMGTIARCYYAVNVRSAPGTGNALVGKILVGTRVEIYEQVQKGTAMWGRVNQGWISMDYVLLDSELPPPGEFESGSGGSTTPSEPLPTVPQDAIYLGSVIGTNTLNVRASASLSAAKVGTLNKGDSIVIYEVATVDTRAWGRCDKGWVNLVYIDLVSCTQDAVDARVVQSLNAAIRDGAGRTYNKIGTYTKGTIVDIFEISGEWLRTDIGWVHENDLLA